MKSYLYAAFGTAVLSTVGFGKATEQEVLQKIQGANQTEIRLGQLAQQRGQSQQVRDFGKKLEQDHRAAQDKVERLAKTERIELNTATPDTMGAQGRQDEIVRKLTNTPQFDREFSAEMDKEHSKTISELESAKKELPNSQTAKLIDELLPKLRQHGQMAVRLKEAEKI